MIFTHLQDCPTNCEVCESTGCLICATNYLFYQEGCVASCPSKTYSDLTSCIGKENSIVVLIIYLSILACSQDNCAECDANECKICEDGYQLDNDKKCLFTITTEESGGVSGGATVGIACGSVVVVSLAAWAAYSWTGKKFPFQNKK